MDWRDAVLRWHTSAAAATVVRQQLEDTLRNRFKNQARISETLDRFDSYVGQYTASGFRFQRARMDVRLRLPDLLAEHIEVTGQVTRLDRLGFRFVACMLMSTDTDWRSELRMPLIQTAVADKLKFVPDEVSVAAYCFETGVFQETRFNDTAFQSARGEIEDVLAVVLSVSLGR